MELLNIKKAFEKKIAEITPSGIDTAYDNTPYKPTKDKPYQRVGLFPNKPENPTFGDNYYRAVGRFEVLLCYPSNKGSAAAYQQASLIQDTFSRGSTLVENGTEIIIRLTPDVGVGMIVDDRYMVPITIEYFASILKN